MDVQVPSSLTGEQRKLLEALALSMQSGQNRKSGQNTQNRGAQQDSDDNQTGEGSDKDKGFFDKIKEVLS